MKRGFLQRVLAGALLLFALTVPARAARRSVPVQIDGETLTVSAYVDSGVTYVPLRALLKALDTGWSVWWDSQSREAAAVCGDLELRANPAEHTVQIGTKTYYGRVSVENGVTYVPLRLVCEALGCQVAWDPYLGGVAVTTAHAEFDAAELYWLSRIIYAESGAESMTGQIAVGNVILNRVESKEFPDSIPAVIFDRKNAVQFEPVANGRVYLEPSAASVEAAKRVLRGENVIGSALYFYAPALSQGVWINANCTYQQTIGCHRFYMA